MNIKKIISLVACGLLIVGCSSKGDTPLSLYDDKSAKETYTTLVDKVNKDVTYVRVLQTSKNDDSIVEDEYYVIDGALSDAKKIAFNQEDVSYFYYDVVTPEKTYSLRDKDSDDLYDLTITDTSDPSSTLMKNMYELKTMEILSANRKDKDGEIVLTMQTKEAKESEGYTNYIKYIYTIGENGLPLTVTVKVYEDETFKGNVLYESKMSYTEYNRKKESDLKDAIKQVKKLDKKSTKEVKETLLGE